MYKAVTDVSNTIRLNVLFIVSTLVEILKKLRSLYSKLAREDSSISFNGAKGEIGVPYSCSFLFDKLSSLKPKVRFMKSVVHWGYLTIWIFHKFSPKTL